MKQTLELLSFAFRLRVCMLSASSIKKRAFQSNAIARATTFTMEKRDSREEVTRQNVPSFTLTK